MRSYYRSLNVEGMSNTAVLHEVGLTEAQVKAMYRYMAIANYEDHYVIPTGHEELRHEDFHAFQGSNGFTFGNEGCSISPGATLFPEPDRAYQVRALSLTLSGYFAGRWTKVDHSV